MIALSPGTGLSSAGAGPGPGGGPRRGRRPPRERERRGQPRETNAPPNKLTLRAPLCKCPEPSASARLLRTETRASICGVRGAGRGKTGKVAGAPLTVNVGVATQTHGDAPSPRKRPQPSTAFSSDMGTHLGDRLGEGCLELPRHATTGDAHPSTAVRLPHVCPPGHVMADPPGGSSSTDKVIVVLKAVGDAPILKQERVKISGVERFVKVVDFLRKQLQRDSVVSPALRCVSPPEVPTDKALVSSCTCAAPSRRVLTTRWRRCSGHSARTASWLFFTH